jgi:hypothetical protein
VNARGVGLAAGLEWRTALRRRRLLVLNIAVPLLLVLPVATAGAPAHHAAAVYSVLFVLFGTFGAAIPLLRDAERGVVRRLVLGGLPRRLLLVERAAAAAVVDAAQLAPAAVLALAAAGAGSRVPALLAVLLVTVLVANLIGVLVAAVARSVAEGALFAAVTALLLLHASGVFRTPRPGRRAAILETAAPFRALHETLLAALGGAPPTGAGSGALGIATVGLVVLVMAGGPRLTGVLARADGRG